MMHIPLAVNPGDPLFALACRYDMARHDAARLAEKAVTGLVWRLPRRIILWATIRLISHGTTGVFGTTSPDSLNVMEALRRWDDPRAEAEERARLAATGATDV